LPNIGMNPTRFVIAANLTGFPAITFPAGYTAQGLPIGMQAIGRAWEESLLLRLAVNAEEVVERKAPKVWYGIL
jgi:Asp-tRNA(Asn)/Glu-tRNA(Gln) amidotransferase A subunit family amidase